MTTRSHIEDDGAKILPGIETPSLARLGWQASNVIQFRPRTAAASVWLDEELADEDSWEQVGQPAVRMVAQWSLPFIHCEVQAGNSEEVGEVPGLL